MIGHRGEIERPLYLSANLLMTIFVRQRDRFAPRITVGVGGIIALARNIGIEGVAAVDVQITEHRTSIRIIVGTGRAVLGPFESGRRQGRGRRCTREGAATEDGKKSKEIHCRSGEGRREKIHPAKIEAARGSVIREARQAIGLGTY